MITVELYTTLERYHVEYFNQDREPTSNRFYKKITGYEFDSPNDLTSTRSENPKPLYETRIDEGSRVSLHRPVHSLCSTCKPSVRLRVRIDDDTRRQGTKRLFSGHGQKPIRTYSCDLLDLFREVCRLSRGQLEPEYCTENYYEPINDQYDDPLLTFDPESFCAEVFDANKKTRLRGPLKFDANLSTVTRYLHDLRDDCTITFRKKIQQHTIRLTFLGYEYLPLELRMENISDANRTLVDPLSNFRLRRLFTVDTFRPDQPIRAPPPLPSRLLISEYEPKRESVQNSITPELYLEYDLISRSYRRSNESYNNDFQIIHQTMAPIAYLQWTEPTNRHNAVMYYEDEPTTTEYDAGFSIRPNFDTKPVDKPMDGRYSDNINNMNNPCNSISTSLDETTLLTCFEMQNFLELSANLYHLTITYNDRCYRRSMATTRLTLLSPFSTSSSSRFSIGDHEGGVGKKIAKKQVDQSDDFCTRLHEHVLSTSRSRNNREKMLNLSRNLDTFFHRYVDETMHALLSTSKQERKLKNTVESMLRNLSIKRNSLTRYKSICLQFIAIIVSMLITLTTDNDTTIIERTVRTWATTAISLHPLIGQMRLVPGMITTTTTSNRIAFVGVQRGRDSIRYFPFDRSTGKFVAKYELEDNARKRIVWKKKSTDNGRVEISRRTMIRQTSREKTTAVIDDARVVAVKNDSKNRYALDVQFIGKKMRSEETDENTTTTLRFTETIGFNNDQQLSFVALPNLAHDGIQSLLRWLKTRRSTCNSEEKKLVQDRLPDISFNFVSKRDESFNSTTVTVGDKRDEESVRKRYSPVNDHNEKDISLDATISLFVPSSSPQHESSNFRLSFFDNFTDTLTTVVKLLEIEKTLYVTRYSEEFEETVEKVKNNVERMEHVLENARKRRTTKIEKMSIDDKTMKHDKQNIRRLTDETLQSIIFAAETLLLNQRYDTYRRIKILLADNT